MKKSVSPANNLLLLRILAVVVTLAITMVCRGPIAVAKDGPAESAPSTSSPVSTIYFQGSLIAEGGEAYPDGLYTISFTFYDASVGGGELWSETQRVYLENGTFTVELGNEKPMNLTFSRSRWLEVRAVDHEEIDFSRIEFLIPDGELDLH
jgi:hypothetical protein